MKIFVCIKQVPDTETKIKLKSDGSHIDDIGVKWIINPYDEFAVEEALRLKEATQGDSRVILVSLGPKDRIMEALRTGLAMGGDEALLVDTSKRVDTSTSEKIDTSERIDAHSTAKALAQVIVGEGGADIIFAGKLSIDDNTSSVSQMLAEHLNMPHTTVVSKFSQGDNTTGNIEGTAENIFNLEREIEGGAREVVQLTGPSVIGVNKGLNTPRYASLPGIMKAKKKPVKTINIEDLNLSDGDKKISFSDFEFPPKKPSIKMVEGDVSQQCTQLVRLLREEAKVL